MTGLGEAEFLVGAAAFLLGGLVKGVIGVALPLIAVSILVTVVDVPDAVALMAIPILAANLWQGAHPAHILPTLKRFWTLLVALVAGLAAGTTLLVEGDPRLLQGLVGGVVTAAAAAQLLVPNLTIDPRHERWASPSVGFVAGVLGGVAATFGPPIATYMVALGLAKETFVASLGVTYFAAAVPLALMLAAHGVLSGAWLWLSVGACVPMFLGLFAGRWLRARIDAGRFRKGVIVVLVLIGLNLIRRAIW